MVLMQQISKKKFNFYIQNCHIILGPTIVFLATVI
jgi:hypothetical protein